ncbi:hypothetical protein PIB30_085121 [Stylosanthes scabra]|uniref:Uncharacterized protein n=1 Tax=Stylosanthes scabra TaxID=79078 RepID=A0ABU6YRR2_9FABA|nr:hypothetical protein [Stylosanthes scabra]
MVRLRVRDGAEETAAMVRRLVGGLIALRNSELEGETVAVSEADGRRRVIVEAEAKSSFVNLVRKPVGLLSTKKTAHYNPGTRDAANLLIRYTPTSVSDPNHQKSPKANNKNQAEVNSLSNNEQYPASEVVFTYDVDRLTTAITAFTRTLENQTSTNLHGSTQTTTPMNSPNSTRRSLNPDIDNLHIKKEYNPKIST